MMIPIRDARLIVHTLTNAIQIWDNIHNRGIWDWSSRNSRKLFIKFCKHSWVLFHKSEACDAQFQLNLCNNWQQSLKKAQLWGPRWEGLIEENFHSEYPLNIGATSQHQWREYALTPISSIARSMILHIIESDLVVARRLWKHLNGRPKILRI